MSKTTDKTHYQIKYRHRGEYDEKKWCWFEWGSVMTSSVLKLNSLAEARSWAKEELIPHGFDVRFYKVRTITTTERVGSLKVPRARRRKGTSN